MSPAASPLEARPETGAVVRARGLHKRFGATVAVERVDLDVAPAECLGLLGPNAAGKTTTVRMLYGHTPATSGRIEVFGLGLERHLRAIKASIGVVSQEDNLDAEFTVLRNLVVHGRYFGLRKRDLLERAEELLAFLQLEERRHARIRELSGGLKRRLVIARALVNAPKLLLLDEPTTGLDPQARQAIWERIRALRRSGTTILLTTHYMEEAAQLCTRVLIMDRGRVLDAGPPQELVARHAAPHVVEVMGHPREAVSFVAEAGWRHEVAGDRLLVYPSDGQGDGVLREICSRFPIERAILRHGSLEDVFLRLTGHELRD